MTPKINEADRYLLEHWAEARDFEEGMRSVRDKYQRILEEALNQLHDERWWESDFKEYVSENYGCIGFGRRSWDRSDSKSNFTGMWLDDLDLNYLVGRGEEHPCAQIWLGGSRKHGLDPESVKKEIVTLAGKALKGFPPRSGEKDTMIICYLFPESREQLVHGLLSDDAKPFIEVLCSHANRIAELIPAVDTVLAKRSP